MIIRGGLGNQLFGLAFAHSLHRLGGEPTALDLSSYGADRYGRNWDLQELAESLDLHQSEDRPPRGGRIAAAVLRRTPLPGRVLEPAKPPTNLEGLRRLSRRGRRYDGYWQNEGYIAEPDVVREAVRRFAFQRGGAPDSHALVMHYRTYKEEIRPAARGAPGSDFVRRAVAAARDAGGRPDRLLLISDDPDLAVQRLGDVGLPVETPVSMGPWADLALLMRARQVILSNSSFSWWGGWCGDAAIRIYPARTPDLFHYPAPAAAFRLL